MIYLPVRFHRRDVAVEDSARLGLCSHVEERSLVVPELACSN
jgi:hypothetical protein